MTTTELATTVILTVFTAASALVRGNMPIPATHPEPHWVARIADASRVNATNAAAPPGPRKHPKMTADGELSHSDNSAELFTATMVTKVDRSTRVSIFLTPIGAQNMRLTFFQSQSEISTSTLKVLSEIDMFTVRGTFAATTVHPEIKMTASR